MPYVLTFNKKVISKKIISICDYLNLDKNSVISTIISEASGIINRDLNVAIHKEVHGWHFANAPKRDLGVFIDYDMKIAACGDWCMHGRVESAYLSGKETASKVLEALA